MLLLSV
jgi:hypothetical protein